MIYGNLKIFLVFIVVSNAALRYYQVELLDNTMKIIRDGLINIIPKEQISIVDDNTALAFLKEKLLEEFEEFKDTGYQSIEELADFVQVCISITRKIGCEIDIHHEIDKSNYCPKRRLDDIINDVVQKLPISVETNISYTAITELLHSILYLGFAVIPEFHQLEDVIADKARRRGTFKNNVIWTPVYETFVLQARDIVVGIKMDKGIRIDGEIESAISFNKDSSLVVTYIKDGTTEKEIVIFNDFLKPIYKLDDKKLPKEAAASIYVHKDVLGLTNTYNDGSTKSFVFDVKKEEFIPI